MTLDDVKERLIAALEVWQEHHDPCENGHVEHTAQDHDGRRLVHTFAGPFGADWDADRAIAYIRDAVAVYPGQMALGHVPVKGADGQRVAFAVKLKRNLDPQDELR